MTMLDVLVAGEPSDASGLADLVEAGTSLTWPACRVTVVDDGDEVLRRVATAPADAERVVVLDVGPPNPDAYELCRRIRQASGVPLLVVSASSSTLDRVRALHLGADVFLNAPVDHLELVAYLHALVRRAGLAANRAGDAPGSRITVGDVTVDLLTHEVRVRGQVVPLTATEYRLLETLVRHAGTTLPHCMLLERVWGPEYAGDTRYLKVFVRRLRRKLGDDADHPRYLHTVWGVGYRFVPDEPGVARLVAA